MVLRAKHIIFCGKKIRLFSLIRPLIKASGDSFEIWDGRILIYSSIGVQNSIF